MPLPPVRRHAIGFVAGLLLLLVGCSSPRVQTAGPRIGRDAYVTFTSPVNVPWMSARDAIEIFPEKGASILAFPLTFPLYLVEHTLLTAVHAVDLAIFPVHFFNEWEPLDIYDTDDFPMELDKEAHKIFQAGSGATLFIAIAVVAAIAIPALL